MTTSETSLPFVSVVMPVRQEASHISHTVGAVLAQAYPAGRFELLVADGMSTDGTREVLEGIRRDHPNLTVLDNPGRIAPTGLNVAIRVARGDVIVRVDGHTEIAPDYVRQCVNALARSGADNAGGRMTAVGHGKFGTAVALATSSPFGVGGARFHYSDREEWVDTVYLGAWRRDVFDRIGLFDEELVRNQDDELNYRLRANGGRILLAPSIHSRYTVRGSPRRLWKQYFQYGFWKVRVLQKHARQMQPRQFVPPAFVGALLTLAIVAPFSSTAAKGLLGLALIYLVANVGTAIATAKSSVPLAPIVALAFAILHLAYGSGFLAGLVRFAGKWGRDGAAQAVEPAIAPPRINEK